MKSEEIKKLVEKSENAAVEFKRAKGGVSADFWPSYSAFANTDGGTIILGIREKDGKQLVVVEVPRAERTVRPVFVGADVFKGTYRRNGEGDYHCSRETVEGMIRDKCAETGERTHPCGLPRAEGYRDRQVSQAAGGLESGDAAHEQVRSHRWRHERRSKRKDIQHLLAGAHRRAFRHGAVESVWCLGERDVRRSTPKWVIAWMRSHLIEYDRSANWILTALGCQVRAKGEST